MKTALWVTILLGILSTQLWAQGDSGDCSDACWTVTDATCSGQANCNNWGDAQTLTFTPACTDTFKFICKTDCENCYACGSCARVIVVSTGVVIWKCQSTLDGNGTCEWSCDNKAYTTAPLLYSGTQYRIEVTLQRCRDAQSCAQCGDCAAKARVYHDNATCTAW